MELDDNLVRNVSKQIQRIEDTNEVFKEMQTMSEITKLSKRVMAEETPNFVNVSSNNTIQEEPLLNPYSNGKSALTFAP